MPGHTAAALDQVFEGGADYVLGLERDDMGDLRNADMTVLPRARSLARIARRL